MKAIMISTNPKWVAKILNGEKTVEIRKRFPKDYRGWVYIYCTSHKNYHESLYKLYRGSYDVDFYVPSEPNFILNGKVVARFYCDNVEEITIGEDKRGSLFGSCHYGYHTESLRPNLLMEQSCLDVKELIDYLGRKTGCAIHISDLEIFDKPKELSGGWFTKRDCRTCPFNHEDMDGDECIGCIIEKAPQSFCYVEVE